MSAAVVFDLRAACLAALEAQKEAAAAQEAEATKKRAEKAEKRLREYFAEVGIPADAIQRVAPNFQDRDYPCSLQVQGLLFATGRDYYFIGDSCAACEVNYAWVPIYGNDELADVAGTIARLKNAYCESCKQSMQSIERTSTVQFSAGDELEELIRRIVREEISS